MVKTHQDSFINLVN